MTQRELTIDDLVRILTETAGEDEGVDLNGDILDRSLRELGYDSLAMMETAARIQQEFGVRVPDDIVMELDTPREVLDAVNGLASATAQGGDARG